MREFEIKPELMKILKKLVKKDRFTYEKIMKKVEEIINSDNIDHYKNLKYDFRDWKRVHIGHFVLVFSHNKLSDTVIFFHYEHHDNIYR